MAGLSRADRELYIDPEVRELLAGTIPPPRMWPRVVLRWADEKDLWVSGMLAGGSELAGTPAVVDLPLGRGHVVLLGNNPMWRHETHGSFMLVLGAALHFDHLHVGHREVSPETPRPAAVARAGKPEAVRRPRKQYTIEQFLATTSIFGPSFSPDGSKVLFTSDATGIPNAYTVPFDGGEATPLTRSTTDSTYAVSYFPRDDRVLFTHDRAGNELNHLFVLEPKGETDLTPGDRLKASFAGWTFDDTSFHVVTNERDPKFFDLYRYETGGLRRTLVYKETQGYFVGGVSGDGRWVALQKPRSTADSDIYLWDAESGKTTHITPHDAPRGVPGDGVRPSLAVALLLDQRQRRVHACPALLSGRTHALRRRSGPLGHPVQPFLAPGPLPRDGGQRRRPHGDPRARQADERVRRAAEAARGRHHFGCLLPR
jgi:hypothetical protein